MLKEDYLKVVAIIPCLNEEKSIAETIKSIRDTNVALEIIVVDNGSEDQTVSIAEMLGVRVLFEPNKGKGFAVRRGFANLARDVEVIFILDGDATYGVENLRRAIDLVQHSGYDMIVGRREIQASPKVSNRSEFRLGHVLGNKILSQIFRKLFRISISDTLSGFRVLSRSFVDSFPGGASKFEIEAELNAHAFTLRAAVFEIPVKYQARIQGSESKLKTYRDGWAILRRNFKLYKNERPLIAYSSLSLPWVVLSGILMSKVLKTYFETGLVPQFPSLMASIGGFVIGCNLWLTGMILEHVRLQRVALARLAYARSKS